MTTRDMEEIACIVSDKISGHNIGNEKEYAGKFAELSTNIHNISTNLTEIKTDVKILITAKDEHSNRLTKLETEKTTMLAFIMASCAIIYQFCATWKMFK